MLRRARTPGFTLVETLVALVVLLAGLAGSTLLLIRTLQHERESAHRRTALRATASLAEELRARQESGAATIDPEDDLVQDWAAATAAADRPFYYVSARAPHQHVAYRGTNGHIYELLW